MTPEPSLCNKRVDLDSEQLREAIGRHLARQPQNARNRGRRPCRVIA